MKVVLLAGGLGTRLAEETSTRPKPMVEIGGHPILWHIMKYYSSYDFHDFVVCLGYKGYIIKEYFANYFLHMSDVTFDLRNNRLEVHQNHTEPWRVTLVDTGADAMTGGRIKRILPYVGNEPFLLTYGDGLSDVDLTAVIDLHLRQRAVVTLTAVQPMGRFGAVTVSDDDWVSSFVEKPPGDSGFINGGFFMMDPSIADYLAGDDTVLEQAPLQHLAEQGKLAAYRHSGFWHPMDTIRDRQQLEKLWASGAAPWKRWPV